MTNMAPNAESAANTAEPEPKSKGTWTKEQVEASDDKLLIIEGKVYKVPEAWCENHPGGRLLIDNSKGADVTAPFLANHPPEKVAKHLKAFYAGDMDASYKYSAATQDYLKELKRMQNDPKWFDARPGFYLGLFAWYLCLLAISIRCVLYGENPWVRVLLGGFFMGAYLQQLAFFGHDIGHNGISHSQYWDEMIGICLGNPMNGISLGWWKATHNVHHLVTNSVEYDPDIQHMPVFAVTDKYFKGVFSLYHFKHFPLDSVSQFFLKRQHYLYYPIMALARFNLYLQSYLLLLNKAEYKKRGGKHQLLELFGLSIYAAWQIALLRTLPCWEEIVGFLLVGHAVAGILHVQITISHFPMPCIDGCPMKQYDFIEYQLMTSMDLTCPTWMDWWHGGLQFQAVHHCFPRIPRHNLRRVRDEVLLPLCKKHGLEYKEAGWIEANVMVIQTLSSTAGKLHEYLKEGWNGSG